jgi:ABC-2 type transport system permease protein
MRRIIAQIRKELIQIVRDRQTLASALFLPLMMLLLLGGTVSFTVTDVPIVVQDLDGSSAARSLADAFRASNTFHIVALPTNWEPQDAFTANTARGALVIPAHFGRDLARGFNSPVQFLVDGSDSNTATLISGGASRIISHYNQDTAAPNSASVRASIRLWYNPGRSSKKFYGPGMFVLGLSMFPALLASLAMAKEGEDKTILQVYVSNISAHEFLLGKIFAFMMVALAEALIMMLFLFTYFGLSFAGDPTPFLVGTILYMFCVAAFGTMVGAAVPSQVAAMNVVAAGGFLLVFLLSGLIYPVQNIPSGIRWISYFVWGRYYIEIVRDSLLRGGGWPATWFKVLVIGMEGAIFYVLAWRSMRRMQVKA